MKSCKNCSNHELMGAHLIECKIDGTSIEANDTNAVITAYTCRFYKGHKMTAPDNSKQQFLEESYDNIDCLIRSFIDHETCFDDTSDYDTIMEHLCKISYNIKLLIDDTPTS